MDKLVASNSEVWLRFGRSAGKNPIKMLKFDPTELFFSNTFHFQRQRVRPWIEHSLGYKIHPYFQSLDKLTQNGRLLARWNFRFFKYISNVLNLCKLLQYIELIKNKVSICFFLLKINYFSCSYSWFWFLVDNEASKNQLFSLSIIFYNVSPIFSI